MQMPEKTVERLNDLVSCQPTVHPVPFSKTTSGLMYRHFIIDCSGFTFVDTMGVNALKEVGSFNDYRVTNQYKTLNSISIVTTYYTLISNLKN